MINRKAMLTQAIENGFEKTSEGYPDTLKYCKEKNAYDYTIYGNTVDGTSVGEKTKNLFDYSQFVNSDTWSGLTTQYLEEEQCFLINGTALSESSTYRLTRLNLKITPNTYFSISTRYVSGSIDKTNCTTQYKYSIVYFGKNDEPNKITNWRSVNLATSDQPYRVNENGLCDCNYITAVWFYINPGIVFDNYKVKIQLEEGSAATSFEPYGYKIPVVVSGKNLLDIPSEFTWTQAFSKTIKIPAGTYSLTWTGRTAGGTESPTIHFQKNNLTYWMTETSRSRVVKLTTPETGITMYTNGFNYAGSADITSTVNRLMLATDNTGGYEPYHTPKTINIYRSEQLKTGESVNYKTDSLPALPLSNETNIVATDTEVPLSNISVTYNTKVKT